MSKHSTHVLVTNPYLTPLRFAQRLSPQAFAKFIEEFGVGLEDSEFAVAPYSQKLQRTLRALAKTGVWHI